jgi:spore coat polysaccharide biosynthesis protein SpsF (cytidylyltransferase family)
MILAILQARYSSSRLPKKVLKKILGKPMLMHQIERLQHSDMIDKLVVATSTSTADDLIAEMCWENNVAVFRGSLDDVLDRYYQCAKTYAPRYIVRLTGDCPLIDWQVVDQTIDFFIKGNFDFVETSLKFPDGLDVEIMSLTALKTAWGAATLPSEKEHVTQFIINRPEEFNNGVFEPREDLSHLRWTVDEFEDFEFVEEIYRSLYKNNPLFVTKDILNLLKRRPSLCTLNNNARRNEGLEKSLVEDKGFLKNV